MRGYGWKVIPTRLIASGLVSLVLCLSLSSSQANALGGEFVIEVGPNLYQNTITAAQSILTVANQVIELTPLDELVIAGEYGAKLEILKGVVEQGKALTTDLGALREDLLGLFDPPLQGPAFYSSQYAAHQREMTFAIRTAQVYAIQTQGLLETTLTTIADMLGLLETMGSAFGNLTISQTLSQGQAKLQQVLLETHVQQTASNRATSLEKLRDLTTHESIDALNRTLMSHHPRW